MTNCRLSLWIGLSWCSLVPVGFLQAQAGYHVGSAPEVSRITVEHTKVVSTRAMWSEFATGGTDPETGVPGEDRARFRRWPAIVGAGVALNNGWPLDFRATYSRSLTDWVISQPDLLLDTRSLIGSWTPCCPPQLPSRVRVSPPSNGQ